ncbi:MAG: hypothetical protein WC389_01515 [Lutibacter sp.]|jgi:hypothetical protein
MYLKIGTTEDRFKLVSNVLEIIDNTQKANELYKLAHSPIEIDFSIFYEVIQSIYNDKPFNDEQLLQCYSVLDELGIFHETISLFSDNVEVILPTEVSLLLFGLNSEIQRQFTTKEMLELESIISDNMYTLSFENQNLIGRIDKVKSNLKILAAA